MHLKPNERQVTWVLVTEALGIAMLSPIYLLPSIRRVAVQCTRFAALCEKTKMHSMINTISVADAE
jgi:hypothetical protein